LFSDWHAIGRPSLRDRNWLPEESGDLLPTLEDVGFWFSVLAFRHGPSTMRVSSIALQTG